MLAWFRRNRNDPARLLDEALADFELPTFRKNVLDAMAKLRDPNASLGDVGDVLAQDPGLSTRLLRLANSPLYGLRHEVDNVRHAVSLLGKGEVEAMVIGVGVGEQLPRRPIDGYEPIRFWSAATRRAAVARAFAAKLHPASKSECFTAGLLQEMAVPLLVKARGREYAAVLERWREGEGELATLEESAFGWTHAFIAGAMAERWGFPADLVDAIGSHHDGLTDGEGGADIPPALALAAMIHEAETGEPPTDDIVELAHDRFGLGRQQAAELLASAMGEADQLVGGFL